MKCTMNALTKQVNPSHIVSAGDASPKRLCPSAKKDHHHHNLCRGCWMRHYLSSWRSPIGEQLVNPIKKPSFLTFMSFQRNNSAIFFGLCWIIIIIILTTTGININMMRGGTERLRVSGQLPSLHLDTRGVAWFQVWACPWWWWGGGW